MNDVLNSNAFEQIDLVGMSILTLPLMRTCGKLFNLFELQFHLYETVYGPKQLPFQNNLED